jgi:hypothetical protein
MQNGEEITRRKNQNRDFCGISLIGIGKYSTRLGCEDVREL